MNHSIRLSRRQLGLSSAGLAAVSVGGFSAGGPRAAAAPALTTSVTPPSGTSQLPPGFALAAGALRPMPDPSPTTGRWQRAVDGSWTGTSAGQERACALSEQWAGPVSRLVTRVTIAKATPGASAGLVLRANQDATRGYLVLLEARHNRVRLLDLATRADVVEPVKTVINPGRPRNLVVDTDGSRLRVSVGRQVLEASDVRHAEGHVGLVVQGGSAHFAELQGNFVGTNLSGWTTTGSGTWTGDGLGISCDGATKGIALAAGSNAVDTELTSLVHLHEGAAVAGLVVRASSDGTVGYAAEIDAAAKVLRLVRLDDGQVLASSAVEITVGKVYRATLRAIGETISLAWQTNFMDVDGVRPVLRATDSTHRSGLVGLRAHGGAVTFQQTTLTGPVTNTFWTAVGDGVAARHPKGLLVQGAAFSEAVGSDVVAAMDADLRLAKHFGITVRSAIAGPDGRDVTGGHVEFSSDGRVVASDLATGAELASGTAPDGMFSRTSHVEVIAAGGRLVVEADGSQLVSVALAATGTGQRVVVRSDRAVLQNLRIDPAAADHNSLYQPRYHYSQAASNTSDPNGLVYFDGEYHLFHQDRGRWAHAVSTDLLHWYQLPIAIDATAFGDSWSGGAIVDAENRSGLFPDGRGLIAYFTSFDQDEWNGAQTVRAAYSSDNGRSWTVLDRVVVPNPGPDGKWDFRDPKITWDPDHENFVMVVSGGDHIRIFTSTNLLDWVAKESFGYGDWRNGGVWECPDLFQLPIAGTDRKRWVLWWSTGAVRETNGSNARYVTGVWDGERFTADTAPGEVLRSELGRDYYAALTFSDMPNGRRVQLAWMSNWDYAFAEPTGRFSGALSIPRELGLVDQDGVGLRLTQTPVDVSSLVQRTVTVSDVGLSDGLPFTLDQLAFYRIRAEIALPQAGGADSFEIGVRQGAGHGTSLVWRDERLRVDRSQSGATAFTEHFAGYNEAIWPSRLADGERRVSVDVFVDASSVEVFRADGLGSITDEILPEPQWQGLSILARGGAARIVSAVVETLDAGSAAAPGESVRPYRGWAGESRANWGEMAAGLGIWTSTGAGLTGTFDRDAVKLSTQQRGDLTITCEVRMGSSPWRGQMHGREPWPLKGQGAAVSIVLRSDAHRRNGYMLNIDPQLHIARVFRITDGNFEVIASTDVTVVCGTTYVVAASAQGHHLSLSVDGVKVVSADDARFGSGHFGVDVFGGRVGLQDVVVA